MIFKRRRALRDANGNLHDRANGRFVAKDESRGARMARLQATAARESAKLDRSDPRLRFGDKTDGVWFIPPRAGGGRNWVPRQGKPMVIRGYYFVPGRWAPVKPPRGVDAVGADAPGVPGQTPLSRAVPADVWEAGHMTRGERREIRAAQHGGDETTPAREVAAMRRRERPVKRTTTRRGKKKG